ncbi:ankyrin repeat domain-containing protein [Dactylosporangium sp. CA-152071]|uniref:ankyrin repeat domain-containing protein n=1 Tax=Dactylosporangium sp. CA-152071 TaxID=3239933 RepID=UPI003D90827F
MTSPANRELLAAASAGDTAGVRAALAAGAELAARDARRRTALLLAAANDHVEAARVLVDAGADPDALDDQHDTPWLVTGVTGSVPMLEVLLPAQPDLTIVNRYGGISIIPASERGHVDYVRRVVQTDINVNHVNNLGWTALLECVILGDGTRPYQQIAEILVAAGANVHQPDKNGADVLQHARNRGYDEIVAILSR